MHELKELTEKNTDFLNHAAPEVLRKPRHLIFAHGYDAEDKITIPICGNIEHAIVGTRRLRNITCPDCIKHIVEISNMENYAEVLAYVTSYAPVVIDPDEEVMKERFDKKPTKRADEHILAKQFLETKGLAVAKDLPLNIIGTKRELFYYNMVELGLLSDDGEPNKEVLQKLTEKMDELLPKQ